MFELLILIIILTAIYFIGSNIEKKHYKAIVSRELELANRPVVNYGAKNLDKSKKIKSADLVTGEVVISGDYFKSYIADLKNLFGGRLTTFESILDRGRREATLRMRESAKNADIIVNTKIESVMLNNSYVAGSIPQCAIIAYGTAITYE